MKDNAMTPTALNEIQSLPGNANCIDCGAPSPDWASISFASLFCIECSGGHRGLGVHISFVRSIHMDSWTDDQVRAMKCGGNEKCKNYLQQRGIWDDNTDHPIRKRIFNRYDNEIAATYRSMLKEQQTSSKGPKSTNSVRKPLRGPVDTPPRSLRRKLAEQQEKQAILLAKQANQLQKIDEDQNDKVEQSKIQKEDALRQRLKERMAQGGIGSDSSYDPVTGTYRQEVLGITSNQHIFILGIGTVLLAGTVYFIAQSISAT